MSVTRGGLTFGFCPAKATWDTEAVSLFQLLVTCTETGAMLESGGLNEQPYWWIELVSWFAPMYNERRFANRVRAIGESFKGKKQTNGHNK